MDWKNISLSWIQSNTQNKIQLNPNKPTKTQPKAKGLIWLIGFAVLVGWRHTTSEHCKDVISYSFLNKRTKEIGVESAMLIYEAM